MIIAALRKTHPARDRVYQVNSIEKNSGSPADIEIFLNKYLSWIVKAPDGSDDRE